MPREARKQSATDLYHIMLRGIDGMDIFREKDDRKMFVTLLKQQISESFKIYCYCLMSNHIHCLIKSEKLSFHLHKLAATYAMWFNHKYERRGYLYQDRFKSEPVEDDTYFIQASDIFYKIPSKPVSATMLPNTHGAVTPTTIKKKRLLFQPVFLPVSSKTARNLKTI